MFLSQRRKCIHLKKYFNIEESPLDASKLSAQAITFPKALQRFRQKKAQFHSPFPSTLRTSTRD